MIVLELLILKLGCYLTNSNSVPMWDFVSYSGYKFVGLCVLMIYSLVGFGFNYVVLLYLAIAHGFFMVVYLFNAVAISTLYSFRWK